MLWAGLARAWSGWQDALVVVGVQPRTVIAWQRRRFRAHWTRLSEHTTPGRPRLAKELRYMVRHRRPPSPTWRAFLATHAKNLVSMDFCTVATVHFEILFVLVILAHDRRQVRHFNVTPHPTAAWTAQQVVEAFPWDTAPAYLLHDRDGAYGSDFRTRVTGTGITEVRTAPRSPWQSPYVERLSGSIRRECLDHVVVLHAQHLRRMLTTYFAHYHQWRCHQGLGMDCPEPRAVQPPDRGTVVEVIENGGLYVRLEIAPA